MKGGRIYGAGQLATTITTGTLDKLVTTNGMEDFSFENMTFNGRSALGSGQVAFELDWTGVDTSIGLSGNIFTNVGFSRGDYCVRIAASGNGGAGTQFYGCNAQLSGIANVVAWSAGALGTVYTGGGCGSAPTGLWAKDGQFSIISDVGLAGNTTQDILIDSAFPTLIKGTRTESSLFVKITNALGIAVIEGCDQTAAGQFCIPAGTLLGDQSRVIIDCCRNLAVGADLCNDGAAQGKVYIRGCSFASGFTSSFAGDLPQEF
jgi:hypothetical protein